ncbi:MAG: M48 family metallopeptidase [Planctomycetota bacterium]
MNSRSPWLSRLPFGLLLMSALLVAALAGACKAPQEPSKPATETTTAKRSTRTSVRRAPRNEVPESEAAAEAAREAIEGPLEPPPEEASGDGIEGPLDPPPNEVPAEPETPPAETGRTESTPPAETGIPAPQEPEPTEPEPAELPQDDMFEEMLRIRDSHLGRSQGMTKNLAEILTLEDEEEIGTGTAAAIASEGLLREPASVLDYLVLIAATLGGVSDRPEVRYRVGLLDSDDINAYSVPGGFLFITRGAVLAAHDEAELAAVLAHEVAHVALQHALRELDAAKYRILMESAVSEMKSELERHGMGGDTTDLEMELSQIADECYQWTRHPHSQKLEREADRAALYYLARSGYDPRALLDYLGRLGEGAAAEVAFRAMSSHPSIADRLAELRPLLEELSSTKGARLKQRFERQTADLRGP